jgi:hypothetical protein
MLGCEKDKWMKKRLNGWIDGECREEDCKGKDTGYV